MYMLECGQYSLISETETSSKDREDQIDRQEQRHRIKDRYIYTELDREREREGGESNGDTDRQIINESNVCTKGIHHGRQMFAVNMYTVL